VELETELRQATQTEQRLTELVKLLKEAQADQGRLLAMPNSLLESQPSLKQLKEGLVAAQLRTAQLRGSMSDVHPQVQSSLAAEQEISRHLHNELATAIQAVGVDWRLATSRVESLEEQLSAVRMRLERLASLRSEYSALVAESDHRTKILSESERELSDALASQEGAQSAKLISRLDSPETGPKPAGPDKAVIQLAGLVGGLVVGFGVLLLTVPPTAAQVAHQTVAPAREPSTTPLREFVSTTAPPTAEPSPDEEFRPSYEPAYESAEPCAAVAEEMAKPRTDFAAPAELSAGAEPWYGLSLRKVLAKAHA
jgi:hypothetical protein